jgi:penicillin amidase
MERNQIVDLKKIIIAAGLSAIIISVFSLPLGMYPALGNFMFPGNGLWLVPDEVPLSQTIQSDSISEDVQVYRDQWGIPHIYGSSEKDIIYALGYLHAQDRLFQMEMCRRQNRGRLSEILGPDYIDTDKFNLAMLKEYWANETLQAMINSADPTIHYVYEVLLIYCEGVNAYISTHMNALPLEFRFLNFEPDPWTPLDSLVFEKYMSEMLTWDYNDFIATELVNILSPTDYNDILGLPLDYQIPICPGYGEFTDISVPPSLLNLEAKPQAAQEQDSFLVGLSRAFMNSIETIPQEQKRIIAKENSVIGSNNWVVNGSKTASHLPILCNDMHLEFALPGIWYEAHVVDTTTGWNGYAFFLAGVPVPIVGHNQKIAWGFTNTAYDVLDWYYYNTTDEDHYMYKGVETAYGKINYTIPVKGQATIDFTVKNTTHGPVFTDFLESIDPSFLDAYPSNEIACKWISQNVSWTLLALYGYSHASNRAEFDGNATFWGAPAQNQIYADVDGHIGIRPTGSVPIRDDISNGLPAWNTGNGTMLYNGSQGEGEWTSYLPFGNLPHSEDPEQCYLNSNNQMVAGPDFLNQYSLQHPLAIDEGYRARRINTLLASHNEITVEDMMSFQLDVYSELAGNMTPILRDVINYNKTSKSAIDIAALNALSSWDYIMDKNKGTPTLFDIWLEVFMDKTFSDEMADYGVDYGPTYPFLEKLTREDEYSHWFDNISSGAVEYRNETIIAAWDTALTALQDFYGSSDIADWKWGDIHQIMVEHITGLEALSRGPIAINGTSFTLTPSWSNHWDGSKVVVQAATWGASERMIVDFSDMNKSISVIPSGQRGVSTSKHYTDQLYMYLNGEYHTQYFGADSTSEFQSGWIESQLKFVAGGA